MTKGVKNWRLITTWLSCSVSSWNAEPTLEVDWHLFKAAVASSAAARMYGRKGLGVANNGKK